MPMLITAGVLTAIISVSSAFVATYQARQRTRRKQIDLYPVTTIADAIAACIDDVHRHAADPNKKGSLTEAERVRNSARQFLSEHGDGIISRLTERTEP